MARHEEIQFTVNEAIEVLASIAEFAVEIDKDSHLSHHECVLIGKQLMAENISWIDDPDVGGTIEKIRSLFNAVYEYVLKRYDDGSPSNIDQETIEGIKKIMVLVGEAANKLDRYTDIFEHAKVSSAMLLPEYRKLQEFYRKKIDQQIDEHILSRWIEGISRSSWLASEPRGDIQQAQHIFVDLDTVMTDSEYELLLLRKEDGSRFYNTRLLRNIKLVCDFGRTMSEHQERRIYNKIPAWRDQLFHVAAKNILSVVRYQMERYYREAYKYKNKELSCELSKVFMALMLAANPDHLQINQPMKTCTEYFYDFQSFLRRSLHTREYQKMIVYPPGKKNFIGRLLLEVTQAICTAVYHSLLGMQVIFLPLEEAIAEARGKQQQGEDFSLIYQKVKRDYLALQRSLKRDVNAPLISLVNWIEEGDVADFDPLVQNNLPNHWFDISLGKKKIHCKRMPCPISQQLINKAVVNDEFKAYVYGCEASEKKHLCFNMQDRTSWREYARSIAMEQMDKSGQFGEWFHVITMATDTDFYHQRQEYAEENDARSFLEQFGEHLLSDYSGYYFPEAHKKEIHGFCEKILDVVYQIFFEGRPNLIKEERQALISIVHLFIQLKCLDLYYPDTFALSCKDGIDLSSSYTGLLFAFWKLLSSPRISEADEEYLNLILFGPSLLIRERVSLIDHLDRFLEALGTIETSRERIGHEQFIKAIKEQIEPLYNHPMLFVDVMMPYNEGHESSSQAA